HYDGLGSTRSLSNDSGEQSDSYDYLAFGELQNQTGTTENNYLYTGEQFDGDLDQYYLRAIYYDQNVGRFTQQDAWMGRDGEPVTLNKYLYTHADPVNGVDPSGYFTLQEVKATIQTSNILVNLGVRGIAKTKGKQLVWNGVCFAAETIAEDALLRGVKHLKGIYIYDHTKIGKNYIGQAKGKRGILSRLQKAIRKLRTDTDNIVAVLPITIAGTASETIDEILDAVEERFIRDLKGPGGKPKQDGDSANKRYQTRKNDKLEKLIKKLKFC
ncbi:RHS repeat-associated core domain-containing protein, partial [Pseudoalteromonas sp. P1-9]|uniref:RHS repeat-associated core domain-containing protein n=1 Tax=Pseudoalteromonas sp. P1-9 TaxID=1710354 RepID=UPI000ACC2EB9